MNCPECSQSYIKKLAYSDGVMHTKYCRLKPGKCPRCFSEIDEKHQKYCEFAPNAVCGCSRTPGISTKHAPYCVLFAGVCPGCGRNPAISYAGGLQHTEECNYKKYKKLLKASGRNVSIPNTFGKTFLKSLIKKKL